MLFKKKKEAKEPVSLEQKEKELYRCGNCREFFPKSKAITVLDYSYKPVKKFLVCPFCKANLMEQILIPKEATSVSQTLKEPLVIEKNEATYEYQIKVDMQQLGEAVKHFLSIGAVINVNVNEHLIVRSKKPLDSELQNLKKNGKIEEWKAVI